MSAIPLDPTDSDRCSVQDWSKLYRVNTDSFNGKNCHRTRSQYNIFTDGSRVNGQTGAGVTIHKQAREIDAASYRLPDYSTVFQAEITAIRLGAERILALNCTNLRFVKIFVDSQAALRALHKPEIRSKSVLDARRTLNKLAGTALAVTLVGIPAHKGHVGNERADELAKKGALGAPGVPRQHTHMPFAHVKQAIYDAVSGAWKREWQDGPGCEHSKQFYDGPNKNKARYVYKLARLELGRFIRLITGHNNLNHFQTRIGLWGNAACRLCGDPREDYLHFVHDCPRLWSSRRELLEGSPPGPDGRWSVRKLIDFSYLPGVNDAFEGTWAHGDPAQVQDLDSDGTDDSHNGPSTESEDSLQPG